MSKINVVTGRTIIQRLQGLAAIVVAGASIYFGAPAARDAVRDYVSHQRESQRYEQEIKNVETFLGKRDIGNAEILLKKYSEGSLLTKTDITAFNLRVESEKKVQRIRYLDNLIARQDYGGAKALYSELKRNGTLSGEPLNDYSQKIEDLSLESLLKKMKTATGEEKTGLLERILLKYPAYSESGKLREEQTAAYLLMASSYFQADVDGEKIFPILNRLNTNLKQQDSASLKNIEFSSFFKEGEIYIRRKISLETDPNISIGDKIRVVKKLGELSGEGKDEYYAGGTNPSLLSEGVVIRMNYDRLPGCVVAKVGGNEYNFALRELEKISSSNTPTLARIIQSFEEIQNTLKNGGKK